VTNLNQVRQEHEANLEGILKFLLITTGQYHSFMRISQASSDEHPAANPLHDSRRRFLKLAAMVGAAVVAGSTKLAATFGSPTSSPVPGREKTPSTMDEASPVVFLIQGNKLVAFQDLKELVIEDRALVENLRADLAAVRRT
jgi:hypothetical protein